jgi:hypothetical protein
MAPSQNPDVSMLGPLKHWALALSMAALCTAVGAAPLKVIEHTVPGKLQIEGVEQPVYLRGHVRVERNLLPWYTIALHVAPRVHRVEQLERGMEPFSLTLVWQENAASAALVQSYFEALFAQTSAYTEQDAMRQRIADFVAQLPATQRGQVWRLDYWPDAGMRIHIDGVFWQRVAGIDMNRAVLGLWLGPKADPQIRSGLLTVPISR